VNVLCAALSGLAVIIKRSGSLLVVKKFNQ
jgi:hypothetical protein